MANELKNRIADILKAFARNGHIEKDKKVTLKDLLTTADATIAMSKTISTIIKEAIEPRLVITPMFQKIRLDSGTSIEFPSAGAMEAADIPEGGEYPEKSIDLDGGTVLNVKTTKVGLRVAITEEMINESRWDLVAMNLRAAGRALARHKEVKCSNLFATMGNKIFDNLETSAAVVGATTGRGINGAVNGGLHMDDIFELVAYMMNSGFNTDTLLMHPLSWIIFAKDPILRELAWMQSRSLVGGSVSGAPGQTGWDKSPNLGYQTMAPMLTNTATNMPAGLFPWPLKVLISPYVRYTPKGSAVRTMAGAVPGAVTNVTDADSLALAPLTDIYAIDSAEVGALVEKESISTEDFNDPYRDIRNTKIRERYGLALLNQGKAVVVARNVVLKPTYVYENVNTVSSLSEATRNV
jgi:hypothetical protein